MQDLKSVPPTKNANVRHVFWISPQITLFTTKCWIHRVIKRWWAWDRQHVYFFSFRFVRDQVNRKLQNLIETATISECGPTHFEHIQDKGLRKQRLYMLPFSACVLLIKVAEFTASVNHFRWCGKNDFFARLQIFVAEALPFKSEAKLLVLLSKPICFSRQVLRLLRRTR